MNILPVKKEKMFLYIAFVINKNVIGRTLIELLVTKII